MDTAHIADLLQPYLPGPLTADQLDSVRTYLELLVRWNAKTNLTAVRQPEAMVQRHFGESLFAAAHLVAEETPHTAIDLGSGAGFPGLPLAIYAPAVSVTLIESQNKKATFLKEVVRTLELKNVTVIAERGEAQVGRIKADLVTLRAVERFTDSVSLAVKLVQPGGRLALLIGVDQVDEASWATATLSICGPVLAIPGSKSRTLLVGKASAN